MFMCLWDRGRGCPDETLLLDGSVRVFPDDVSI